ncbi:MAG: GGDEF domain-containing protein [Actinomycetota bacterium]
MDVITSDPMTHAESGHARSGVAGALRLWLGDAGGKVTAAMGVLALAYLVWQHTNWGGVSHHTIISDAAFLPLSIAGAVLARRAARAAGADSRTRQAWTIVGAAFLCYWLGDVLWFYFENFRSSPPFPSIADAGYIAFYPLLLIGLLRFPVGTRGRIDRAKFWLDMTTVSLGAFMVVWFFVLGPTAHAQGDGFFAKAISIAYPVGDLVLIFGVAAVMLRKPSESSRRALAILAIGLGLFVVADVGFGYASLQAGYSGGDWPDSLWMCAQFLMLLAAQYHYMGLKRGREETLEARVDGGHIAKLPYAAVVIAFGLLMYVGHQKAIYPLDGLIVISVAVTAAVLVRQMTVMRDNARLMSALQTLATTDPLTGLRNRRDFFDAADLEFGRLKRFGIPFVAMMVDIDHFKEVNDRYGHAGGDAVLSAVARTCHRRLRSFDIVGRYGGDELVVLLPKIELGDALAVAERVGVAVRGTPVLFADEVIPVSLSVGLASADGVITLEDLLHRADTALYCAKQAGRNCVRTYDGTSTSR